MIRKLIFLTISCLIFYHHSHGQEGLFTASLIKENKTSNMDRYDANYYKLNLNMDPSTESLNGYVKIRVTVLSNISQIEFHFNSNMIVDSIKIENLMRNFNHDNNILSVQLDKEYDCGEIISLIIFYHGSPIKEHFLFGYCEGKPMICMNNILFGARTWFPCKDIPEDKADSMDIIISVPEELTVVSCGKLISEKNIGDGKKQFCWHEKYPIATHSVGITAYDYTIRKEKIFIQGDTVEIYYYYIPEHADRIYDIFEKTKVMLNFFSSVFGKYPFADEKFALAESVWGKSDFPSHFVSHQSYTDIVLDDYNYMYFDDAMSGQWFGQMISCANFHHIWLMTGMMEWGRYLWFEWFYGHGLGPYQYGVFGYFNQGTIFVENVEDQSEYDRRLITFKASYVIKMLRFVLGDASFFKCLRAFCSDPLFKYGTATTEQFQTICEQVSGMELGWFFQQWFYDVGYPEFQLRYKIVESENNQYDISGTIKQIQTIGPIFKTPINLTIERSEEDSTLFYWIDKKEQSFSFRSSKSPQSLILNKDKWLVCKTYTIDKTEVLFINYNLEDFIGNGDQHPDAGETIRLIFSVKIKGIRVINPTIHLSTSAAQINLIDSVFVVDTIEYDSTFTNNKTPFVFSVRKKVQGCLIPFQLKLTENGETIWCKDILISVGESNTLLIDNDFEGLYESKIKDLLAYSKIPYKYWEVRDNVFPDSLMKFQKIIWFTGEAKDSLLSNENKNNIIDYLNQGGRLLITSQNLAYDLNENGDIEDSLFLANYLGVEYFDDKITDSLSAGVVGDPVSDRQAVYFYGSYGVNNQMSRDIIKPVPPAISILTYFPSLNSAGTRLANVNNGSKVVYLPFGLEGVAGPYPTSAANLLSRILDWFDSPVSEVSENFERHITSFLLFNNYPNPFNPTTNIKFSIDDPSQVSLKIYNIMGQEIVELINEHLGSGIHSIKWGAKNSNGLPVCSGVYFAKLVSKEQTRLIKLLLIR